MYKPRNFLKNLGHGHTIRVLLQKIQEYAVYVCQDDDKRTFFTTRSYFRQVIYEIPQPLVAQLRRGRQGEPLFSP